MKIKMTEKLRLFLPFLFLLLLQSQYSQAQKYTFVHLNNSIADFRSNTSDHYTFGVGQVISESALFKQSLGLRYTLYKRPNKLGSFYFNQSLNRNTQLLSVLETRNFSIFYQVKRKLYRRLFLLANLEGGVALLNEEFEYLVKEFNTKVLLYEDDFIDKYKANLSYGMELGLEYFLVENPNYFISASFTFQLMDRLKDFEFKKREGEFIRYENDDETVVTRFHSQLYIDYFWLGGVTFGVKMY